MKVREKTGKQLPTISRLILGRILICSIVISVLVLLTTFYFSLDSIVNQTGESRIEVLQQINSSNSTNRHTMENTMDDLTEDVYTLLEREAVSKNDSFVFDLEIERSIRQKRELLHSVGNDYNINLVLNDGRKFYSDNNQEKTLKSITQTYWYITHFMGERDRSWNMTFLDPNNINSFSLSLAQTIYFDNGNVVGVIIITSSQQNLFETYMKVLSESNKIYILDENGIAISHSNNYMNGVWMYDMDIYKEKYGFNTYRLEQKYGSFKLISNYHDTKSGWTIVEEKQFSSIFYNLFPMLVIEGLLIALVIIAVLIVGYFTLKRINKPLINFSNDINEIRDQEFTPTEVRNDYKEISIITKAFNSMLERITKLIDDIQEQEKEKNRIEYDFLQAQIDPHFMHNTLLSIKSMIALEKSEDALKMMEAFVDILRIPMIMDKQFITLEEEIELTKKYITIMQYRTGREFKVVEEISPELRYTLIPRMILQPLVANSIFHGFSDETEEAVVIIRVFQTDKYIYIYIIDNGEGMTSERSENIFYEERVPGSQHNHISLKNVRNRVKILYGNESDINVDSEYGIGTAVSIEIYKERYNKILHSRREENENTNY